jgi:motility/secretion related protein SprA
VARFVVALSCLVTLPGVLAGQVDTARADTSALGARLTFSVPLPGLREPAVLRAPWRGAHRASPGLRAIAWDSTVSTALASARRERAMALRYLTLYGVPVRQGQPEDQAVPSADRGVLGLSKKYADVALDGQVRVDLRTDRLRSERCSPQLLLDPSSGCRGGFKAPRLDNQFTVRSSGIIGRRVHINVDYDNERDFGANNNVQVYYEGLEDEIVRRIEVGTVTFQAPPSRFITAAIPANNFGVNARFELGALQIQALAATQKGSQVAERTYTIGQTTSQPQDRHIRDLDFESGRFFWVVDPSTLPGYPAIDILSLGTTALPTVDRPTEVQVYRYRAALDRSGGNPNISGITARAQTSDGRQVQGPVRWELLIRGSDYYLDPSGLWIALSTKLDQNDFLAVSYRTSAGILVGSLPVRDVPQAGDSLRLIVDPKKGPEFESFRHEMRQIYQVAGSALDPTSLQVNLSLNRSERPQSTFPTYLSLFGLATATDPNVFDRENRLFPRTRDPEALQILHESYIIFPHLTPFSDNSRLNPGERSDSLYRAPLYLLLSQGPPAKYQMRLRYNSTGAGDRSSLSLDAIQVRNGSEQLFLGGKRLVRGIDYSISYDVGRVTFLNPDALFGNGTAEVTARFEEQALFAVAPTTILGLATRYGLGDVGAINLVGMFQREQTAFNRPPLGFEAAANLVGGVTTELHFKPQGISRLFNHLTTTRSTAPSLLDLNAEFAFTKPDPNRSGQAYVEGFESDVGIEVPLQESLWGFGSVPSQPFGVEDIGFGAGFDPADAVALTWQNLIPGSGSTALELHPQDIDTLIRTAGRSDRPEPVLFLTLHADTAGGIVQPNSASRWTLPLRLFHPRWRSIVTPLSSTVLDVTRSEYLEFWVFQPASRTVDSAGVKLVLDLGSVNEDALAIAPDSLTVVAQDSVYTGRQLIGLGRLDSERSSTTDIFNANVDDIGILGDRPDQIIEVGNGILDHPALCHRILSSAVPVFPWGDLSSRCTNGNGTLDTEDLNGDNVLNASGTNENVFRYVVSLQPGSKYYVRDGVRTVDSQGGVSKWELYRIPIRSPDAVIGTPNLRLTQNLRITVAAPPDNGTPDVVARFALARMRLVGSSWVRRAETPIAGLSGSSGKGTGEIIASVISTENRLDLGYQSPPGVADALSKRGADPSTVGTQINEKSLRMIARGLELGDRAEAYLRFPAGPQNLLNYRELRVWARGRGSGWEEGNLEAFIKLGSDDRNFYLYHAPAHSMTWEPEFAIDLEKWRKLRADLETRWLRGDPPSGSDQCGGDAGAYVACEGPYLVHLADPGTNPPNLAAVQEVSAGILRVSQPGSLPEAELWVDDIRMTRPASQIGTAVALDAQLTASDVGSVTASFIRQDGQFHQLSQDPSYQTTGTLRLNSNWRLDRFLPASLGLAVPVTVSFARSDIDPQLLTSTDLRGSALAGLRQPHSWSATYTVDIRRSQPGGNWLVQGLVNPLTVSATLVRGNSQTELSSAQSQASAVSLTYGLQPRRRGLRLPLGGLVKGLPKWMRESEWAKGLANATFGLVPSNIRWSSALSRDQSNYSSFSVPVVRSDDSLIVPTLSLSHLWRNSGGLVWQPLGMLQFSGDLTSTRDLRVYPDSTSLGRVAYLERRFLLGIPVGVERDRTLTTALVMSPRLTSWLRPRFASSSRFVLSRTLSSRPPVRLDGDSGAFFLPQTLNNTRGREIGVSLDLSRALRQVWGDSSGLGKLVARIRPVDFSTRLNRGSTFDLSAFDPDVGFMLALGGLDRFLTHVGENALGVTETRSATLSSGADLPLGLNATLSYSLTRTNRFQLVPDGFSTTTSRQREWPVLTMRWTRTFAKGPLTMVTAGSGIRRREGTSTQPSRDQAATVSATSSSMVTPDFQIGFRNGLALTLGLSSRSQRTENNGNATLLDQEDLSGAVNYSFRLPRAISPTRKMLHSTLSVLSSKTSTCLDRSSVAGCTVVSDVRRQEVRGGLDTDLLNTLSGGLQFGYSINDARHLSQRTSQISLLVSLQLSLYAGDYR